MARFQPKIRSARFVSGPFSPEQMQGIGDAVTESIRTRIANAVTVEDAPAKPLSKSYAKAKVRRGRQPVRDWQWRGKTLRSLKLKSANENKAVIGFVDPEADKIAHINNARQRLFGVSGADRNVFLESVRQAYREGPLIRTIERK